MSTEQPPMDGEQWAEASTRGALIAQLRGQREAGEMILTELRECREENARLRAVLETRQATVGALAYALEGLVKDATLTHEERIEMANRWLATKGYHDVEEFYPPNEEADDA